MSDHPCPNCGEILKSEKKYNLHLAIYHEATQQGPVMIQSIKSLERTKDRVHFLLRKFPATRSSDILLWLYFVRLWGYHLVYNQATQLIEFRNRQGISIEDFIRLPNYETCRRSRQHLQEKHEELKASDRVEALRLAKEKGYHRYFAEQLQEGYLPNLYIPGTKED